MIGPRVFTNCTEPRRPFSARFRSSSTRGAETRVRTGRVFRDSLGRLRNDIELGGILVGSWIIDDPAAKRIVVNHMSKSYAVSDSDPGEVLRLAMPDDRYGARIIEGLHCVRYPPRPGLDEAWLSPELEYVVFERSRDLDRVDTWEVFDIERSEPDPSLFLPPPGYNLVPGPDA